MSRRKFLKQSSCLTLGILTYPTFGSAFSLDGMKDVVIGHNSHKYKVDMGWGNLNPMKIITRRSGGPKQG